MISRANRLLLLALLAAVIVGCQEENGQSLTSEAVPGTDSPSVLVEPSIVPTWTPVATVSQNAVETPVVSAGETGYASLPDDLGQMFDQLGSYRVDVTLGFEGEDAVGEPLSFDWQTTRVISTDPAGSLVEIVTSGDPLFGGVESLAVLDQGSRRFVALPTVGCISGEGEELAVDSELPVEPVALLDGLSEAGLAAEDALLDATPVTAYRFDQESLSWSAAGPWSIDGVAYVDHSNGLLSQVLMTVAGQGNLLDSLPFTNGTYEIVVEIVDLPEDSVLDVPDACVQGIRYPVTDDAFELSTIEDLLAYKSRGSLTDVVEYYLAEMPTAGWRLLAEPEVFEDLAILTFTQGDDQVLVSIEYDPEANVTMILVSP